MAHRGPEAAWPSVAAHLPTVPSSASSPTPCLVFMMGEATTSTEMPTNTFLSTQSLQSPQQFASRHCVLRTVPSDIQRQMGKMKCLSGTAVLPSYLANPDLVDSTRLTGSPYDIRREQASCTSPASLAPMSAAMPQSSSSSVGSASVPPRVFWSMGHDGTRRDSCGSVTRASDSMNPISLDVTSGGLATEAWQRSSGHDTSSEENSPSHQHALPSSNDDQSAWRREPIKSSTSGALKSSQNRVVCHIHQKERSLQNMIQQQNVHTNEKRWRCKNNCQCKVRDPALASFRLQSASWDVNVHMSDPMVNELPPKSFLNSPYMSPPPVVHGSVPPLVYYPPPVPPPAVHPFAMHTGSVGRYKHMEQHSLPPHYPSHLLKWPPAPPPLTTHVSAPFPARRSLDTSHMMFVVSPVKSQGGWFTCPKGPG